MMSVRNLIFAVVVLLIGCGDGHPPPRSAELSTHAIVHGTRGPTHVTLYQDQIRAIGFVHATQTPQIPFCTGTVVAPGIVITAGHCTNASTEASQLGFSVGEQPTNPEARFEIDQIHTHPTLDIAVLVLAESTASAGIVPIAFNRQPVDERWINDTVEVAGYGETLDAARSGRWFAALRVTRIDPDHIVVDGDGLRGLCSGDSGSPSIGLRGDGVPTVIAIESGGEPTCVDRDFMVRVDKVKQWIDEIIDGENLQMCEEIPAEGICLDTVLQRCSAQGTLTIRDCSVSGGSCLPSTQTQPAACSCGPVSSGGRCNGEVAEICREDRLHRSNCAALGLFCGWTPDGVFACTNEKDCGGVGDHGYCADDALITCSEGQFRRTPCQGATCVELQDGATCITPDGQTFGRPPPDPELSQTQASCAIRAHPWLPVWQRR